MRVELQPCELASLIEEAVASLRPAAESKGVRLETQIEKGLSARCDAGRMAQILWNLLSNAVKFTPSEGTVKVRAARDSNSVIIVVEDTGAGIKAEDLPLIFQRFWQGETTQAPRSMGLGLGLALTRHLVELHGGTITATSEGPGRGARFEVSLPQAR
jgi:signal transduction histidine kinase